MAEQEAVDEGWLAWARFSADAEDTEVLLAADALEAAGAEQTEVERTAGGASAYGLFLGPPPAPWAHRALPPHRRVRPGGLPEGLVLEAEGAWGSGMHPTTALCLAMGRRFEPRRVLDVGTGTGVLALALLKAHPECEAVGTDIADVSLRAAAANARRNGVQDRFRVQKELPEGGFDGVFANIRPAPLLSLAPDLVRRLSPDGELVVSGLRFCEAEPVERRLEELGVPILERWLSEGWFALRGRRATS